MSYNDRLTTYAGDEVLCTFGPVIMTGFGPDDFVSIERNSDSFSLQVGADGESTRSKSNDRSARITVTLMQSSSANAALATLLAADENAPGGASVLPLQIKDSSGFSLHAAEKAWIVKPPVSAYGKESGTREWVFETPNLVDSPGGN